MKNHVKIGKAMEFYKEENGIVRISVEIPNSWSEYIGEDSIESYCWTAYGGNSNAEIPFNSKLKFKEDMLFKMSDIVELYNYISHLPENLASGKHFAMKSLEIDGQVYYISIFPIQQTKDITKIAFRIAKYQYQPFMEKTVAVVFFPLSYQLHLKHYLREFLT
jgi:hypothetical protein